MIGPRFSKVFTGRQQYPYSFLHKLKVFPWRIASQETHGWGILTAGWAIIFTCFTVPVHLALNSKSNVEFWKADAAASHYAPFKTLKKKDWVD